MKQFGSFTLDTLNECLWRDGCRIPLPPKPFAVLRYMVDHPGRLVSHDELLDALWPETYVQPQVLRTYMLDLRKILDDDPRCPRFIQSLPKRGYCFIAPVTDAPRQSDRSAQPSPPTTQTAPATSTLASRDRELASLHTAIEHAANGLRQIFFVTGESGIGKTALVEHFSREMGKTGGVIIALGQCIPGFAGKQDYYPIFDALRLICSSPEAPVAYRLLHRRVTEFGTNANPQASAPLPPGDVCAALEQIPEDKPLLLLIEDLQWADESTIGVISALARRQGPAKLMIVATLAPQTGSTAHAITLLLHDLRMRHLCCEINLPRLARPAVGDLIGAHLQQQVLPDGLREFVYQHSEGNPRFAVAILDHLTAENILVRSAEDGHCWTLRTPLEQAEAATPGELSRMIELEIEHLTPREQQILEVASLAPIAFPAWMVAAALAEDVAWVEEVCDDLSRRVSFVKRAGEDELPDGTRSSFYVFAHAMYRDVLYQRQSPARRSLRHIRIAERLCQIFRGREDLIARDAAAHYQAAGDVPHTIAMLKVAARRALQVRAYSDAADLHQQIAELSANAPSIEQHANGIDTGRPLEADLPVDAPLPLGSSPLKP